MPHLKLECSIDYECHEFLILKSQVLKFDEGFAQQNGFLAIILMFPYRKNNSIPTSENSCLKQHFELSYNEKLVVHSMDQNWGLSLAF